MKKKNIITTAALFLSLCLFTGAKIENVKAEGIIIEDLIRSQNDWVLNAMIIFRFDNRVRMEYMEGKDTIDGVVYDDFGYYQKAFRNKYVYQKEELNEILKEAYTQQKK